MLVFFLFTSQFQKGGHTESSCRKQRNKLIRVWSLQCWCGKCLTHGWWTRRLDLVLAAVMGKTRSIFPPTQFGTVKIMFFSLVLFFCDESVDANSGHDSQFSLSVWKERWIWIHLQLRVWNFLKCWRFQFVQNNETMEVAQDDTWFLVLKWVCFWLFHSKASLQLFSDHSLIHWSNLLLKLLIWNETFHWPLIQFLCKCKRWCTQSLWQCQKHWPCQCLDDKSRIESQHLLSIPEVKTKMSEQPFDCSFFILSALNPLASIWTMGCCLRGKPVVSPFPGVCSHEFVLLHQHRSPFIADFFCQCCTKIRMGIFHIVENAE